MRFFRSMTIRFRNYCVLLWFNSRLWTMVPSSGIRVCNFGFTCMWFFSLSSCWVYALCLKCFLDIWSLVWRSLAWQVNLFYHFCTFVFPYCANYFMLGLGSCLGGYCHHMVEQKKSVILVFYCWFLIEEWGSF